VRPVEEPSALLLLDLHTNVSDSSEEEQENPDESSDPREEKAEGSRPNPSGFFEEDSIGGVPTRVMTPSPSKAS
jgi:hypothetical protein